MTKVRKLFLSGIGVSGAIAAGRALGFFREVLLASSFGKTYEADIVTLSFLVPDLLVNLVLGGAFSAAFLPAFVRATKEESYFLVKNLHCLLGGASLLISFIFFLFSSRISEIIAPSLTSEALNNLSFLLKITCWSLPFIVCSSIVMTALNAREIFFMPALGTSLINISICAALGASLLFNIKILWLIALSITFGAFLRWLFQVIPLYFERKNMKSSACSAAFHKSEIFSRYKHAIIATSFLLILPIVSRYYMLKVGEGQLSNLNYTQKILDVFVTLLSGSIITVLVPSLVNSNDNLKIITITGLLLFLFLIFISVIFYQTSPFLADKLFGYGAFDAHAVESLTLHMKSGAFILPVYAVVFYLTGSLAVTKLSYKSAVACLLGLFSFFLFLHFRSSDLTYDVVYQSMGFGFLVTLIFQILFITLERRSHAKSYVYN